MADLSYTRNFANKFNENLLSVNSLLNNSPTITYNGNGSLTLVDTFAVTNNSKSAALYSVQDIIYGFDERFNFGNALEYTVERDGIHVFSFQVCTKEVNSDPDFNMTLKLIVTVGGVDTHTFPILFNFGSTKAEEFYTFSQSFDANQGDLINFKFEITNPSVGNPNPSFYLNFSGFKLEIEDKDNEIKGIPTPYSLPSKYVQSVRGEVEVWDLYGDSQAVRAYTGGVTTFKVPNDAIYNNFKILTGAFNSSTNQLNLSQFVVGSNIEITLDCQVESLTPSQVCYFIFFASIGHPNQWDANVSNELTFKTVGWHRVIAHVKYPIEFQSDLDFPAEIRFYSDSNANLKPRFLHIVTKIPTS